MPHSVAPVPVLIGALVGFSVAGFFVSAEYFGYLYFILGLAVGFAGVVWLNLGGGMSASLTGTLSATALTGLGLGPGGVAFRSRGAGWPPTSFTSATATTCMSLRTSGRSPKPRST